MSNYHIRGISKDGRNARVIFHIPIPAMDNSASTPVPYRIALSEYVKPRQEDGTFGDFASSLQGIAGAELTQLQAGELYEYLEIVKFLAEDTNPQKKTKIDDRYTALAISIVTRIQAELKFWGMNVDV